MPRIVYNVITQGGVAGGVKMALRHVETLRDLGFDAVCYLAGGSVAPTWFAHRAPIESRPPLQPGDTVVLADDATPAIRTIRSTGYRTVVFAQNPYYFAACSFETLDGYAPERFPTVIAVSEGLAALTRRAFPQATVEVVPCFADERLFRPGGSKTVAVAHVPRKRPLEVLAIRGMFRQIHRRHIDLDWWELKGVDEARVADAFRQAAVYLSLNRLESVGMTTLEAMASGCLCAGFTGVGGAEYATPANGFWAPEDDCEAASDALAEVVDLALTGGPRLAAYVEAGRETASRWSYARFRAALEETWMRIAPEARVRDGPLD